MADSKYWQRIILLVFLEAAQSKGKSHEYKSLTLFLDRSQVDQLAYLYKLKMEIFSIDWYT